MQVISPSPGDRYYAVAAVGQFGIGAKAAVPILVALLRIRLTDHLKTHGMGNSSILCPDLSVRQAFCNSHEPPLDVWATL